MTTISSAASAQVPALLDQPSSKLPALSTLSPNDTKEYWGCERGVDEFGRPTGGIFYVVDTGRRGPDQVKITIHEDGSVTVNVNGEERNYAPNDPEQERFVRVRKDEGDTVEIEDRRSMADKIRNPNPVEVFEYNE